MNQQEKNNSSNHEAFDEKNLNKINDEAREKIKNSIERSVEDNSHEVLEDARREALEQASTVEKEARHEVSSKERSPAERRGPLTKRERDKSFDATMREINTQMSGASRNFSKFIHNKTVESVSDAVGGTLARPNAILSGSIFAFLLTLVIYLIARYNGYPLSGTETIASFAIGWVLGLTFDYFRVLISGKAN